MDLSTWCTLRRPGGVQVWLMLEAIGRHKPKFNPSILNRIHRINGYLFLTLYLIFLYIMVNKVADANSPLDTKTIIHMTLAISIIPLLLIKILIVRYYPKAFDVVVPLMGIGIFTLATSLVFITRRVLSYKKCYHQVREYF